MSSLAVGRRLEDQEQRAMPSLTVGRGLEDLELWLAGLFTAAELAAADLLLQLSVAGADVDKAASTSATPVSSPRSASSCCDCAEGNQEGERVVEAVALPLRSMELDRRARKRYRLLSDLYAGTCPVISASAATKVNNRKRHRHYHDGSSSVEEATRYGAAETTS